MIAPGLWPELSTKNNIWGNIYSCYYIHHRFMLYMSDNPSLLPARFSIGTAPQSSGRSFKRQSGRVETAICTKMERFCPQILVDPHLSGSFRRRYLLTNDPIDKSKTAFDMMLLGPIRTTTERCHGRNRPQYRRFRNQRHLTLRQWYSRQHGSLITAPTLTRTSSVAWAGDLERDLYNCSSTCLLSMLRLPRTPFPGDWTG
jgi:hypothetical protein